MSSSPHQEAEARLLNQTAALLLSGSGILQDQLRQRQAFRMLNHQQAQGSAFTASALPFSRDKAFADALRGISPSSGAATPPSGRLTVPEGSTTAASLLALSAASSSTSFVPTAHVQVPCVRTTSETAGDSTTTTGASVVVDHKQLSSFLSCQTTQLFGEGAGRSITGGAVARTSTSPDAAMALQSNTRSIVTSQAASPVSAAGGGGQGQITTSEGVPASPSSLASLKTAVSCASVSASSVLSCSAPAGATEADRGQPSVASPPRVSQRGVSPTAAGPSTFSPSPPVSSPGTSAPPSAAPSGRGLGVSSCSPGPVVAAKRKIVPSPHATSCPSVSSRRSPDNSSPTPRIGLPVTLKNETLQNPLNTPLAKVAGKSATPIQPLPCMSPKPLAGLSAGTPGATTPLRNAGGEATAGSRKGGSGPTASGVSSVISASPAPGVCQQPHSGHAESPSPRSLLSAGRSTPPMSSGQCRQPPASTNAVSSLRSLFSAAARVSGAVGGGVRYPQLATTSTGQSGQASSGSASLTGVPAVSVRSSTTPVIYGGGNRISAPPPLHSPSLAALLANGTGSPNSAQAATAAADAVSRAAASVVAAAAAAAAAGYSSLAAAESSALSQCASTKPVRQVSLSPTVSGALIPVAPLSVSTSRHEATSGGSSPPSAEKTESTSGRTKSAADVTSRLSAASQSLSDTKPGSVNKKEVSARGRGAKQEEDTGKKGSRDKESENKGGSGETKETQKGLSTQNNQPRSTEVCERKGLDGSSTPARSCVSGPKEGSSSSRVSSLEKSAREGKSAGIQSRGDQFNADSTQALHVSKVPLFLDDGPSGEGWWVVASALPACVAKKEILREKVRALVSPELEATADKLGITGVTEDAETAKTAAGGEGTAQTKDTSRLRDMTNPDVSRGGSRSPPTVESGASAGVGRSPSASQSQDTSTGARGGEEGRGRRSQSGKQNEEGVEINKSSPKNEEKTSGEASETPAALSSERKRLRPFCIDREEARRWPVRYPDDMIHTLPRMPAAKRRKMRQEEMRCYSSEERKKLTKHLCASARFLFQCVEEFHLLGGLRAAVAAAPRAPPSRLAVTRSAALQELQHTMRRLPPSALFGGLQVEEPFACLSFESSSSPDRVLSDEATEDEEDVVDDRDIFFRIGGRSARRTVSPVSAQGETGSSRSQRAHTVQVTNSVDAGDDSGLWTSASESEDAFPFSAGDAYSVVYSRPGEECPAQWSLGTNTFFVAESTSKQPSSSKSVSTVDDTAAEPGYGSGGHDPSVTGAPFPSATTRSVSSSSQGPPLNSRSHTIARMFRAQRESLPWLVPRHLDEKGIEVWLRRQLRSQKRKEIEFRNLRLWQLERKASMPGVDRLAAAETETPPDSRMGGQTFLPQSNLTEEEEAECIWLREERRKKWERIDKARRQLKVQLLAQDAQEQEQLETRLARQYNKLVEKRERTKAEVALLRSRFPEEGQSDQSGKSEIAQQGTTPQKVQLECPPDAATGKEVETASPVAPRGEEKDAGRKVSMDTGPSSDPLDAPPPDPRDTRCSIVSDTSAQEAAIPGAKPGGCENLSELNCVSNPHPGSELSSSKDISLSSEDDISQSVVAEKGGEQKQKPPGPPGIDTAESHGPKETNEIGQLTRESESRDETCVTFQ
ncbi:hypothetical protein CSUI_010072, partial [Cystoisospora suis]